LSGYAFAVDVAGSFAYVGYSGPQPRMYEGGLCVVDVGNPARPRLRGAYPMPGMGVSCVQVAGGLVYAAEWNGGLWIFEPTGHTQ
jgi:hypothetical protein